MKKDFTIDELYELATVLRNEARRAIQPSRRKVRKAEKLLARMDIVNERIAVLEKEEEEK